MFSRFFWSMATACCCILVAHTAKAQPFAKGNFVAGIGYQTMKIGKEPGWQQAYGIHVSYFIADRWSLEYTLSYVNVPYYSNYFKIYGGGLLAGYGAVQSISYPAGNGWLSLAFLALIVPEGISYHLPLNEKTTFSPYVSPLAFDISDSYLRFTNSFGARLNMVLDSKLAVSPYMFGHLQYRSHSAGGTRGGAGVGASLRLVF